MASNLSAFKSQLENFVRDIKFEHVQWVKKIAEAAHTAAYQHTPIDTSRAMSGWVQTVDVPFDGEPDYAPGSKGSTIAEAVKLNQQSIREAGARYKFGHVLIIRNNVPYIEILESGEGSPQAPSGMMRFAIDAAIAEMNR